MGTPWLNRIHSIWHFSFTRVVLLLEPLSHPLVSFYIEEFPAAPTAVHVDLNCESLSAAAAFVANRLWDLFLFIYL